MDDVKQSTKNIYANTTDFIKDKNVYVKRNSHYIVVIFLAIVLVITVVLYIISGFITTNVDAYIYAAGYILLATCTLIMFLFVNLCLNYRKSSGGKME